VNATDLSLFIGFFMPLFIEVVKQGRFPDWVNGLIVILSCVAAGFFQVYFTGQLANTTSYIQAIAIILPVAILSYKQFWQSTLGGDSETFTWLNKATNL
jgi:hypothetical protein